MKTIIGIAALAALVITAAAGPANWPPNYLDRRVKSKAEAEALKPETKIALACTDCKTVTEKSSSEKKTVLAWFKPHATHGCDGCKGKITVRQNLAGKGPAVRTVTHECSKCGKDSAFTCATHAKRAK